MSMKIQFTYLSLFTNRLIKCLSILLLLWFSSTILLNAFSFYFQNDSNSQYEYCDFTPGKAEPANDQESQKEEAKESNEEFITDKKQTYAILLEEKSMFFYTDIPFLKGRVTELLTPPPQLTLLISQA